MFMYRSCKIFGIQYLSGSSLAFAFYFGATDNILELRNKQEYAPQTIYINQTILNCI